MEGKRGLLEKILRDSVGGKCTFPEKVSLPLDAQSTSVTRKVRGGMGESTRFKKVIKEMLANGQITEEQAKGEWAKVG